MNFSPYTDEDWFLRSEVPSDPSFLAFGLPQVWYGTINFEGDVRVYPLS